MRFSEEQKRLKGWQSFELAHKYYVIAIGILWIAGAIIGLIYFFLLDPNPFPGGWAFLLVNLLAGVLILLLSLISRVSD